MSRNKYPLTTETKKLLIVIRKNKVIDKRLIQSYCDNFMEKYVFIEHTKDKEPISGQIEGTHYHIVGVSKKGNTRLQTHLNDLVKYFRFDNANGVEIDKYDNLTTCIQYLIHKNNPEKTPHTFDELIYKWDKDELLLHISSEVSDIMSFDLVYSTCLSSNNIVDVIKALGIKQYHRYRTTIKDIFECINEKRKAEEYNKFVKACKIG